MHIRQYGRLDAHPLLNWLEKFLSCLVLSNVDALQLSFAPQKMNVYLRTRICY